jgi:hypothetical protein
MDIKKKKIKNKTCFELTRGKPLILKKGAEGIELEKGKRHFSMHPVYCILPNGYEGYRLDYVCDNKDFFYSEDIGTIIFDNKEKKWKIINW